MGCGVSKTSQVVPLQPASKPVDAPVSPKPDSAAATPQPLQEKPKNSENVATQANPKAQSAGKDASAKDKAADTSLTESKADHATTDSGNIGAKTTPAAAPAGPAKENVPAQPKEEATVRKAEKEKEKEPEKEKAKEKPEEKEKVKEPAEKVDKEGGAKERGKECEKEKVKEEKKPTKMENMDTEVKEKATQAIAAESPALPTTEDAGKGSASDTHTESPADVNKLPPLENRGKLPPLSKSGSLNTKDPFAKAALPLPTAAPAAAGADEPSLVCVDMHQTDDGGVVVAISPKGGAVPTNNFSKATEEKEPPSKAAVPVEVPPAEKAEKKGLECTGDNQVDVDIRPSEDGGVSVAISPKGCKPRAPFAADDVVPFPSPSVVAIPKHILEDQASVTPRSDTEDIMNDLMDAVDTPGAAQPRSPVTRFAPEVSKVVTQSLGEEGAAAAKPEEVLV